MARASIPARWTAQACLSLSNHCRLHRPCSTRLRHVLTDLWLRARFPHRGPRPVITVFSLVVKSNWVKLGSIGLWLHQWPGLAWASVSRRREWAVLLDVLWLAWDYFSSYSGAIVWSFLAEGGVRGLRKASGYLGDSKDLLGSQVWSNHNQTDGHAQILISMDGSTDIQCCKSKLRRYCVGGDAGWHWQVETRRLALVMLQSVCGQKVTCFGEQAVQVVFINSKLYECLDYLKVNKKKIKTQIPLSK